MTAGHGVMRRVAIRFDVHDHVTRVDCEASPDVIEQLRACLSAVRVEPGFRGHHVVLLPVAQVAVAAKWAGRFSPNSSPDYAATHAIYKCLTYGVCNLFWENGVDDALDGSPSW